MTRIRILPPWGIVGPSWGHLEAILGHRWAILKYLGTILGRLGTILEPSWRHSEPSWGDLGTILGPSWRHLGPQSFAPSLRRPPRTKNTFCLEIYMFYNKISCFCHARAPAGTREQDMFYILFCCSARLASTVCKKKKAGNKGTS